MTITQATNNEIKRLELDYSPELFTKVKNELEKTFVSKIIHTTKATKSKLGFINSNLTTDTRLK